MAKITREVVLKLSEDIRLLAHWEPSKERRVTMCLNAADLLLTLAKEASWPT